MADRETELEWEKSKRIETERMKAAQDLEGNKDLRVNSAFLDSENRKIHGYSRDESRILRSIEKASGLSIGFVILGIITTSSSRVLAMVSGIPAPLAILFNIISRLGLVVLFIAPIMAIVSLWSNYRYKNNDKSIITNAVVTLVIFVIYIIVHFAIIK